MKIVALDGSPHGERGNTTLLLERVIAGAMQAGAQVERIPLATLQTEPCCCRMVCWYKTPGRCIYDDEAAAVVERMALADTWVLSTPVHVGGMTRLMVRFMERTVMLLSPLFEVEAGATRHVGSPGAGARAVALISTCGYYEESAFESTVCQVTDLARSHHRNFAGALLRPHGLALRFMEANGIDIRDVLDNAERAGAELARTGSFGAGTMRAVARPLMARDDFVAMMNNAFERRLGCRPG